jgi:hypothetical protein
MSRYPVMVRPSRLIMLIAGLCWLAGSHLTQLVAQVIGDGQPEQRENAPPPSPPPCFLNGDMPSGAYICVLPDGRQKVFLPPKPAEPISREPVGNGGAPAPVQQTTPEKSDTSTDEGLWTVAGVTAIVALIAGVTQLVKAFKGKAQ